MNNSICKHKYKNVKTIMTKEIKDRRPVMHRVVFVKCKICGDTTEIISQRKMGNLETINRCGECANE